MVIANRKKYCLFHVIPCLFRNNLDGALVLGGSDPSLYEGQISYIDLIKPAKKYRIPVDVGVGDQHNLVCNGECSAIIDTGAPQMYASRSKIEGICNAMGGKVSCYFII